MTKESDFEDAIEQSLINEGGYVKGNREDFNKNLVLDTVTAVKFLKQSQPEQWQRLEELRQENTEQRVIARLHQELNNKGTLHVLRHGFIDFGVRLKMAFFKPASGLNPETRALYEKNILTVTRQFVYSNNSNKSIDLLLCLNGIPLATVELKNPFTNQTATDAIKQLIIRGEANTTLFRFKKRALVHFAVDSDEVHMSTRLEGQNTRFLPFNKGFEKGAGNPPRSGRQKTAYLWEEIWAKDSWLDIIANFLHLEITKDRENGIVKTKEKLIFPRYHQLDVVRKLTEHARKKGPGCNYLIQHSAGSGKSNSIAWLAYSLSSLHNEKNQRVFDSVIVITDRKVLDQQLQDTIYQFEHKMGVVQKIDKDSTQLAQALEAGINIIITTQQKFEFVVGKIGELPRRNYALIVDEAHRSQGGKSSQHVKDTLTVLNMPSTNPELISEPDPPPYGEEEPDFEDTIREIMQKRGKQPNLSSFAFTATPKPKTLEFFGSKNKDGTFDPFHLYSMRQAIEENFIMDVLRNYTTYKAYFRLSREIEDDPRLNKKKAKRAISRFIKLHPHNAAQKAEIIIEHFRSSTMYKINGNAKAMVVTSSRPQLILYKKEFDKYIDAKGYDDIKTLVAFSSFTDSSGTQYSEYDFNGFSEKELPEKFAGDQYQILLVAEKYQTGFDQPLLHTMYVDKKLSGVKAVQTLSRLNRVYPGKEDTFVLDFANDEETIEKAFQQQYENAKLMEATDPNKLYNLMHDIETAKVIRPSEVNAFAAIFFKEERQRTKREHGELNAVLDAPVDRFEKLEDMEKENFKHTLITFTRLYSFMAQIMPFSDIELEKFYAFGRLLLTKLPKKNSIDYFKLADEISLEYYRLKKIKEGSIELKKGVEGEMQPITDAGAKKEADEEVPLSKILEDFNATYGTAFSENDSLFITQIKNDIRTNKKLESQARSNSIENFKYGFEDILLDTSIHRHNNENEKTFVALMDNPSFRKAVMNWMIPVLYREFREKPE